MKIQLQEITLRDLSVDYSRNEETGEIRGYKGKLNIRPPYQREYVYKDKQRDEVVHTVQKGFPLNSIYWVKNGDEFEVLDGQQRTISICDFIQNYFSVNSCYFHNLPSDIQNVILDYKLMVYVCAGEDSEKLDWFRVINIAGEKLSDQELRNAVYVSPWLSSAKKRFSKRNSLATQKGGRYLKGDSLRQDYLETAIAWIQDSRDDAKICEYMAKNAKDSKNSDELWQYFSSVIDWVETKFKKYRNEMKGLEWGFFYNKYKNAVLDADELETEIDCLMEDSEVRNKSGIYLYVLSRDERHLNLRVFDKNQKREMYEKQDGICANQKCRKGGKHLEITEMEADHIVPWSKGGKTDIG